MLRSLSHGVGTVSENSRMTKVSRHQVPAIKCANPRIVLLQHQKSKHFKCQLCPRKLNVSFAQNSVADNLQTAGGLMVHSQQVHKCDPEP